MPLYFFQKWCLTCNLVCISVCSRFKYIYLMTKDKKCGHFNPCCSIGMFGFLLPKKNNFRELIPNILKVFLVSNCQNAISIITHVFRVEI